MSDELVVKAINAAINGESAFCKFLSANDSGETGGHQSGVLISTSAKSMLFTAEEMREEGIPKKYAHIRWQDDYDTTCTFTWYESKRELRITGFGRGKSPLHPDMTGDLFVLVRDSEEDFQGFFLDTDDDIREFLDSFGMTPAETNRLIEKNQVSMFTPAGASEPGTGILEDPESRAIAEYIAALTKDFPTTDEMSAAARMIHTQAYHNLNLAKSDPDNILLRWTEQEFTLFKAIENDRYLSTVTAGFQTVDAFVDMANQVLNRRKSRAGKSLEHHLAAIFDENLIQYTAQALTEGKKKPDFIFPSVETYHDMTFDVAGLCMLGCKTTCKDRWRQILNEANRLRDENKYLCTMQQGISAAQMDEMQDEKVILVVPRAYINTYPGTRRDRIWTVRHFVDYVKEMEGIR